MYEWQNIVTWHNVIMAALVCFYFHINNEMLTFNLLWFSLIFTSTTKCLLSIFSGFRDWSAEEYGMFLICSFSHDRVKTFSSSS